VVRVRAVPTSTILLTLVGALCCIGLVMVGSASSVISLSIYGSPWAIFIREALWMALGLLGLAVAARVDYRHWRRLAFPLLVGTFALLFVVLLPGIGQHVSGSSRWLGFGEFQVQPSELMKLAIAVFGAEFVTRRMEQGASDRTILRPLLVVAGAAALLILIQPDLGTAVVIGAIAVALLFASGVSMKPVLKAGLGVLGLALLLGLVSPYRRARLLAFFHPTSHASTSGYQVLQSLIGLGSGHVVGVGLGNGRQQWGFLPNAHTDFIFSVIGEELGLIGTVTVLLLLGALAWFGLRAAARAPDRFGGLLAVALTAWIATEAVINVGAVIGVLPVTGIPLPFISYGGSSLVITLLAAGILVNIARHETTRSPRRLRAVPRRSTPGR
jgi:cell division protein FtsW